jgi:glycosyltransferase involved in cell wall biosynthesis
VGRISHSKNLHTLIDAVRVLGERGVKVSFDIIGAPVTLRDIKVEDNLKKQMGHLPEGTHARLMGIKTQAEVAQLLCSYDFFIHASTGTGSIDKAVLEALAAGVPVVSTSEAFKELLSAYKLFVEDGSAEGIADAVRTYTALPASEKVVITEALRARIVKDYSLSVLIPRILSLLAGAVE